MPINLDFTQHTLSVPGLDSVVDKAVSFFLSTPTFKLPLGKSFPGAGVYALYYCGSFEPYTRLVQANCGDFTIPIYIGKAEFSGKRTGRVPKHVGRYLYNRLARHVRNIESASETLKLQDFQCRLIIMGGTGERDLISPVEAELIRRYQPLWNSVISGFGCNIVGKNREKGTVPMWDTLHSGRAWSSRMTGGIQTIELILTKVQTHFETLRVP